MGLQVVPGYIGQSGYNHPVELFRNLLKGQTAKGKGYMGSSSDFALTPSGAGMSMSIAAGFAAILGEENNQQGSYFAWSNASESIAWPAASGQPRIDSLLLRVIDTQYGTDPSPNGAYWEVVQGVPAGSPVARLDADFLPGGGLHRAGAWWRVADVLVPNGISNLAAGTITDKRNYADFQRGNNNTVTNWKNQVEAAWSSYTPVWTSSGTAPSVGNGTIEGKYMQVGKTVSVRIILTLGSTSGIGSGTYLFSLPVAPKLDSLLTGLFQDASNGSVRYGLTIHIINNTAGGANMRMAIDGTTNTLGSATPVAPAVGDKILISGVYEADV